MRVTTKGQVTIPQHIRDKMGITPATEVDFVEKGSRVYLVKQKGKKAATPKFVKLRGVATVKMTTDEIMAPDKGGCMKGLLVDSNVILDLFLDGPNWADWSESALSRYSEHAFLYINPIIYTEISFGFEKIEDLEAALH